jgi:hypothetical protein
MSTTTIIQRIIADAARVGIILIRAIDLLKETSQ